MTKQNKRIVFTSNAKLTFTKSESEPEKIATLSGYALLWNVLSTDRGGYKVRLLPYSATFTPTVFALYHHDFRNIIGTTDNGSLRMFPDDKGVKVEIDLPDTSTGRDVEELVENGYVTGMSFSMVNGIEEGSETTVNGETIQDAKTYTVDEVTVTAIPSFEQTTVEVSEDDVAENEPAQLSQQKAQPDKDYESLRSKYNTNRLFLWEWESGRVFDYAEYKEITQ